MVIRLVVRDALLLKEIFHQEVIAKNVELELSKP